MYDDNDMGDVIISKDSSLESEMRAQVERLRREIEEQRVFATERKKLDVLDDIEQRRNIFITEKDIPPDAEVTNTTIRYRCYRYNLLCSCVRTRRHV